MTMSEEDVQILHRIDAGDCILESSDYPACRRGRYLAAGLCNRVLAYKTRAVISAVAVTSVTAAVGVVVR